jgi:hypothetical protein
MIYGKIRHPEDKLVKWAQSFGDNPDLYGQKLKVLGDQKGYEFVRPALKSLDQIHTQDTRAHAVITCLRSPEWEWRRDTENPSIYYFGISADDEVPFEIRGYYEIGKQETGTVEVFAEPPDDISPGVDPVSDPRNDYHPRKLVRKIYKYAPRKWYVVTAGRVVDLAKAGYKADEIRRTKERGYLKAHPAYVRLAGPFRDVGQARQSL